jgi:putative ABC transport system permease protein
MRARFWRRRDPANDFNRELDAHLELEADELRDAGLPAEEARYAARRAFGNAAIVAEEVRAVWCAGWLDALRRDLRYTVRVLGRNPGFAVVAALTLALGIGANTAIFTAIDALMLRPLPFAQSDRLVRLYATKNGVATAAMGGPSPLDARDYAKASRSFESIVVYDAWRKNVSFGNAGADPEQMRVGLVPAAYFETLGIQPLVGRLFADDENREGKNYVAAISARLWNTRFARDRQILGRTLRINDEPYTIVAVMPDVIPEWMESARSGSIEVWTPLAFSNWWLEASRGVHGDSTLARLKPGVTLEQAQADLSVIAAGLAATHPVDHGIGVVVERLADTRVGALRPMLFLLMGAVGFILLIACVNLANLLLARNSTRQRELALRVALGAGRGGLLRQLLAETLLLSLIGGSFGLGLAQAGLTALATMHPAGLPQLDAIAVDWRVLAFTVTVSIATSLLFGLAPALTATRVNLVDVLKQGGRGTAGAGGQRLRHALVVVEMAMSLMLLVGAGLLVQSIVRLQHQGLGIRQDHLLKGHFYLPPVRYPDPDAITRFSDAFADSVRALPGVLEASITTAYPPNNGWAQMVSVADRPVTRVEDIPSAQFGVADSHFLATMGIPLLRGRNFDESDRATSAPVAIVSAEFVRRYFSTRDPVGQQIHIGPPPFLQIAPGANTTDASDVTIVGVAGDFRNAGLAARPEPHVTVLYSQHPLVNYGFKDIVIRTASAPHVLASAIGRQLHRLDSNLPLAEVQTIDEIVEQQTGGQRLTAELLALFAAAGFALAVIGIYGVVSFLVAQRKVELAVRLAVGASHPALLWLVLKESLGMAAIGAAIGLAGAAAAQRLTTGLLFGISPVDPVTFAGAAAFLMAFATIATIVPGLRVTRIDPARTLCQD